MPAIRKQSKDMQEYKHIKEPSLIFQRRVNPVNNSTLNQSCIIREKEFF